ncbi:MAG: TlpA family protein disulfide reductase [Candidatus Aminicenantes bacterium]|nr:MAG: TlpA family protein disulfide reductase [Candidatus Aminicenantes bacterium]
MKKYTWVFIPLVLFFIVNAKAEMMGMSSQNYPDAPDFTLEDLKGNKISLSSMSGKVVMLNVWATWCGPCKREIPDFIEAYEQYKDKGLEIIGISVDEISPSRVLQFTEKYKINYPVAMTTSKLTKDYGPFRAVPVTIIIDKNGKIRHRQIGQVNKKFVETWFAALIEEK